MELAIGNFLTFTKDKDTTYQYQNFFIDESIQLGGEEFLFLPFAFSGVTVNSTGDGVDAQLFLPNNEISRGWADEAVAESWVAHVRVLILDPDDTTSVSSQLSQYYGQVSAGGWNETALTLQLNTVLDAVAFNIPQRRLTETLVGKLPTSANVRLQ